MPGLPTLAPLTLPRPTGRSGRVGGSAGWSVMAALGLHAALGVGLFLRTQALVPGHMPGHTAGHTQNHSASASAATVTAAPMQVRWAPSAPSRVAALSAEQAMSDTARPAEVAEAAKAVETAEAAEPLPASPPTSPPAGPAVDTPVSDAAASPKAPTSADSDTPFTGYARRDMLDRPPQALGIVQIGYPPGVEPGRVRTGRLTLFIDEAGAVRKVMVASAPNTEDALPAPFVEAAREAFLQARFAPGERLGMAVKSRIDVEVSFDGRETNPADPASPVETAQQPLAPAGRSV